MFKYLTTLLCVVLIGLAQAADVEHLVNGSFEAGSVPAVDGWGTWSSVGDNWSFGTDGTSDVLRTYGSTISPWWGRVADDGDIFVALSNAASASGWITQQLTPMVIGETYDVNFSATLGPGEADTSKIKVYIGNTLVYEELLARYGWYTTGGDIPSLTYIANGADGVSPVFKIVHENVDGVSHKMCLDAVSVFGPEGTSVVPSEIDHVVNGSFEIGVEVENHTGDCAYSAGEDADYWTYMADPCDESMNYRVIGFNYNPFWKSASDGTFYVALKNYGTAGAVQTSWLEQELLPLSIGQTYTVSYDVTLNPEGDSGAISDFAVMIGDTLIERVGVMRYGWYSHSLTYTANVNDGVTPKIKLIHINPDGLEHIMLYDNVVVFGQRNDHPDSCPGAFVAGDINKDCYVNMVDMEMFVAGWLTCNEPTDSNCWLQ